MTSKMNRVFKYIFLSVASFVSIFPFFWMVISATNKSVDVTRGKLIPGSSFMENLNNLFKPELGFASSLVNSAKIAIITTILALLVSSIAGYGFEIFRTKARDRLFNILLLSMMVPFSALMIPLFKFFSNLKSSPLSFLGVNTLWAVVLPSVCTAFLIFFFRQNTKSFPKEILEAARIDGLGEVGIFFKIFFPTMRTTYAAAAIITFYGRMECLFMAIDCITITRKENCFTYNFKVSIKLFSRLWVNNDGYSNYDFTNCICILCYAKNTLSQE